MGEGMNSHDLMRLSMCEGKAPLTWAEAVAILARSHRNDKKRQKYHCPVCHTWHLGRKQKKIRDW